MQQQAKLFERPAGPPSHLSIWPHLTVITTQPYLWLSRFATPQLIETTRGDLGKDCSLAQNN